jgi:hypothetical protein
VLSLSGRRASSVVGMAIGARCLCPIRRVRGLLLGMKTAGDVVSNADRISWQIRRVHTMFANVSRYADRYLRCFVGIIPPSVLSTAQRET